MKFLFILAMAALAACEKPVIVVTPPVDGKTVELVSDTIVNDVWDGGGKVLRITDKIIRGTGTLQNWVIDAPLTQQIFDTSINLVKIQTYGDRFSTAWYGAKTSNPDNWWNIQKSINTCLSNSLRNCYTPNGNYKHSQPLEILTIYKGAYSQSTLHFFGDASMWDNGQGTTFQNTSAITPSLNLQLNKGSEIDHIVFKGLFQSPGGTDSVYFSRSIDNFKDVSPNNCGASYCGIIIDWRKPLDGVSISGSTGIRLHEITITNFTKLLVMSPNGVTKNDDILIVDNLHLGDGQIGIVNGQAQEKNMVFNGIYAWGSLHTVVSIGKHGSQQAGDYKFNGANIAGRVIRCFDISAAHWFSTHITGWFAESIGTIGNFSTQIPLTITNSTFDLNYWYDKKRVVITSNSNYVSFNNCIIRYYDGLVNDVYASGIATFNSCYFGGGKLVWK